MKCYNSSSSNSLPKKGGGGSGGSVESAVCFLGLKQLFFKVMVAAMGCIFSCFRVKDSTHNRSSSPFSTPPNASVRSSSSSFLFLCFGFCLVMFLMSFPNRRLFQVDVGKHCHRCYNPKVGFLLDFIFDLHF